MQELEKTPNQQENSDSGISRRDVLLGVGAAATFAYAGTASAAKSGHDHSKHTAQKPDVLNAANACVDTANRCIAHCLVTFQEGDTELADCASVVHEMEAVCTAFTSILAANSIYTKDQSRVCAKVCKDCAKECRKHSKHIECKACAEACDDIVDAIKLHLS